MIYGPLKNSLGFSRVRLAYTAGEAIGPDIFDLFPRPGHEPEAALWPDRGRRLRHHPEECDDVRSDTVGVAIEDVELKFDR